MGCGQRVPRHGNRETREVGAKGHLTLLASWLPWEQLGLKGRQGGAGRAVSFWRECSHDENGDLVSDAVLNPAEYHPAEFVFPDGKLLVGLVMQS